MLTMFGVCNQVFYRMGIFCNWIRPISGFHELMLKIVNVLPNGFRFVSQNISSYAYMMQ